MDREISRIPPSRLANCIAIRACSKYRTCRCKTTNTGDRIIDSLFLLAEHRVTLCIAAVRGLWFDSRSSSLSTSSSWNRCVTLPRAQNVLQRFPPEGSSHNSSSFTPTVYYIVRSIVVKQTNPTQPSTDR